MVSAKPKIAFVVSSQLFVRNYFRTDALSRLEAECDVTFLVSDTLTDMDPIQQPGRKVVVYQSDLRNRARQYDTYKVLIQR